MADEDKSKGIPLEEMSSMRGYIMTRMAYLESGICKLISSYYFEEQNVEFIFDLLYHEYVNFRVKVDLLENILTKKGVTDFPFNKLKRLLALRNIFAHAWHLNTDVDQSLVDFILINRQDEDKDVRALFEEFKSRFSEVSDEVMAINEKGILSFK